MYKRQAALERTDLRERCAWMDEHLQPRPLVTATNTRQPMPSQEPTCSTSARMLGAHKKRCGSGLFGVDPMNTNVETNAETTVETTVRAIK